jgi:hypothetical protein
MGVAGNALPKNFSYLLYKKATEAINELSNDLNQVPQNLFFGTG